MAKHTIKGYITFNGGRVFSGESPIGFSQYKPSAKYSPEITVIRDHEFEVETPDNYDPRAHLVENLEEQKNALRAEFALKVKEIDRRIQSVMAIAHTV